MKKIEKIREDVVRMEKKCDICGDLCPYGLRKSAATAAAPGGKTRM